MTGWVEEKQPSKWSGRVHGYDVIAEYSPSQRKWFWAVFDERVCGYATSEHNATTAATLAALRLSGGEA